MDKNNSNSTELILTVAASIAAFLAGTGIIDVDLGKVVQVSTQVKEIAEGVDTSSVKSIVDGVYKIVCLILGGGIIMTYLKYKAAKEQKIVIQKTPEPEKKEEEIVITPDKIEEDIVIDEDIPDGVIEDPGADKDYGLK